MKKYLYIKNNSFVIELITSFILMALAIILLNPFGLWMPDMMVKIVLVVLLIIFATFTEFVWKEKVAKIDPWLLGSLAAMVLAKLAGLIYSQTKH